MIDVTKTIKVFTVESTSSCNFNCCFCPQDKMQRKKGVMDFETFKKIVDEVKNWNIKDFSLTGFGEPLMDPNIFKKVKYARENMPRDCVIEFNTNASLLTKEKFIKLIQAGLDELRISHYSTNSENCKLIHGFDDFEKVKKNIEELRKIKRELRSRKPVISMGFLRPYKEKENRENWCNTWRDCTNKFYLDDAEVHNFSEGMNFRKVLKGKRLSCGRPFSMGQILWNGDVCICCADYEGKEVYGNVKDKSVKQIMFSPAYQRMLRIHKKRKFKQIPLCDNCDQLVKASLRNKLARFKFKYIDGRYAGG